jgi:hypothetical protein
MQDFDSDPRRFVGCAVGGPVLIYYVSPTEEELFSKYNPDLQKRSLENRIGRQQDFDNFVVKLKEYSKSDKPSMPHRFFVGSMSWLVDSLGSCGRWWEEVKGRKDCRASEVGRGNQGEEGRDTEGWIKSCAWWKLIIVMIWCTNGCIVWRWWLVDRMIGTSSGILWFVRTCRFKAIYGFSSSKIIFQLLNCGVFIYGLL